MGGARWDTAPICTLVVALSLIQPQKAERTPTPIPTYTRTGTSSPTPTSKNTWTGTASPTNTRSSTYTTSLTDQLPLVTYNYTIDSTPLAGHVILVTINGHSLGEDLEVEQLRVVEAPWDGGEGRDQPCAGSDMGTANFVEGNSFRRVFLIFLAQFRSSRRGMICYYGSRTMTQFVEVEPAGTRDRFDVLPWSPPLIQGRAAGMLFSICGIGTLISILAGMLLCQRKMQYLHGLENLTAGRLARQLRQQEERAN